MKHSRMFVVVAAVLVTSLIDFSAADGAGRAFPVESENFAIEAFRKINPSLKWDETNFLVDLSGLYANCKYLNQKGHMTADRYTPTGAVIQVFIDSTVGDASDIDAVHLYIKDIINRWVNSRQYNAQLRDAKRFGCSVRPLCSGNAVVACVSTDDQGDPGKITDNGNDNNDKNGNQGDNKGNGLDGFPQKAQAFTPQQYDMAESILGSKWDRSHFLEDLSGFETDCQMITRNDYTFNKIQSTVRERKIKVTGQYGHAPNRNSTPNAMRDILSKFKPIQNAKQVGCSLITDCRVANGIEVVVACLYEEN